MFTSNVREHVGVFLISGGSSQRRAAGTEAVLMLTHSLTPRGPAPTLHTQPFRLHIPATQSGVQTSNVSNRSTNMSKHKNYF